MLIENRFNVDAQPDDVYALMVDVERVAPCLPGTEITGRRDDGGYDGQMSVKLGPMKMKYNGTVSIDERDHQARTAVMVAKGTETRGQGSAQGIMTMEVTPKGAGCSVSVSTDISVTGRVAQMGQGIMKDVSTKMVKEMARNMEQVLTGEEPARPELAPPAMNAQPDSQAAQPAAAASHPEPVVTLRPASSAVDVSHVRLTAILRAVIAGRLRALADRLER